MGESVRQLARRWLLTCDGCCLARCSLLLVCLTQLSLFSSRADEHLDSASGHGHESDAALLILLQLRIGDIARRLTLRVKATRSIIAVATPIAVVNAENTHTQVHSDTARQREA